MYRAHAHDAGREGRHVVGLQAGNGLHAQLLDHALGGDHHKGRAVGGLRAVARGHASAGGKHGAQLGQAFHVGAAAHALVHLKLDVGLAALSVAVQVHPRKLDRRNAGLQASVVDGRGGALVGAHGKGVLGFAAHLELFGHRFGGQSHAPIPIGVGPAPRGAFGTIRQPPIGMHDMLSVPPAITSSCMPVRILAVAIAMVSSPLEQYRFTVMPGTFSVSSPMSEIRRPTFRPCSASGRGVAHDHVVDQVGVKLGQGGHKVAHHLCGEVVGPDVAEGSLGGFADRTAGSGDDVSVLHNQRGWGSVAEDLSGLNEALHAFQRFALLAEFHKGLALEVQQVAFAHFGRGAQVSAAH